jgi:hypothetical protein
LRVGARPSRRSVFPVKLQILKLSQAAPRWQIDHLEQIGVRSFLLGI